MNLENVIKHRALELCEQNHMSMDRLADEISQELVDELLDDTTKTKVPTVVAFCQTLQIDVADFFRTDAFLRSNL